MDDTAYKDTLCALAWNYPIVNLGQTEVRSCCHTESERVTNSAINDLQEDIILNSPQQKERREALLKGIRHPACKFCWAIEDAGGKSPRQNANQFYEILQQKKLLEAGATQVEFESVINNPELLPQLVESDRPRTLEISVSNTCDLKCMYCGPAYSTQWAAELVKFAELSVDQQTKLSTLPNKKLEEVLWRWLNNTAIESLVRIVLIGGEPLIMPDFYRVLEELIRIYSLRKEHHKKVTLAIVSNLNTPKHYFEKFLNFLPKLCELFIVEVSVSMESTGKKAEYIRNGLSWERFVSNIHTLLSSQNEIDFGFVPSLNLLSIADLPNFIKFVKGFAEQYNRPISLVQNTISYPAYQSPAMLTADFASYVEETISYMKSVEATILQTRNEWSNWSSYIEYLYGIKFMIENEAAKNVAARKQIINWFETYNSRRGLKLLDVFPDYEEFFYFLQTLE